VDISVPADPFSTVVTRLHSLRMALVGRYDRRYPKNAVGYASSQSMMKSQDWIRLPLFLKNDGIFPTLVLCHPETHH